MESLQGYRNKGAETFRLPQVVEAYDARPDYPLEAVRYILDHALSTFSDESSLPFMLDAGAGNGLVYKAVIDSGEPAQIVALDLSEAMGSAFRVDLIDSHIPFAVGNFEKMPFPDNTFDAVIFGTALHWGDPATLPGELYRVLRPGGSVISIGNATREHAEFTEIAGRLPGQVSRHNPMTRDKERIELGPAFDFECFEIFPNDIKVTLDAFNRLLMSFHTFKTARPQLLLEAWEAMQDYARRNMIDGLIPVPFDTLVRIARVKK